MLRRGQFASQNNSLERYDNLSPYKNLDDSPSKRQRKPSLVIAEQLRNNVGLNQVANQDFSKRLEQIKRKYTSPTRNKTTTTAITQLDLNTTSKRSIIAKENFTKMIEEITPIKNITKPVPQTYRTPLNEQKPITNFNQTMSYTKSQLGGTKKVLDEQRINSIDKINEKIKSILDGINYQNDRFNDQVKKTEPAPFFEQKVPGPLSIRPDFTKQRRHMSTHVSVEKDNNQAAMKKSFLETYEKDRRPSNKEFQSKMQQIQQKIKRSQENRLKLMQNYEPKQTSPILPSTHTSFDKKPDFSLQNRAETQKQKPNPSGQYSHRYMDFGKNISRNILQQLKSFGKGQTASQSFEAPPVSKTQTRRLINTFVEQVKLDQQFRNAKIWLQTVQDQTKWTKLKQIISRRETKLHTEETVKGLFKCSQDDHNPFFVSQQNQSFQSIVSKYLNSEEFWNNSFFNKFDLKKLSEQGFKTEILDLELKGYLQIEDIVRYLNIETGKFYRNRDLICLFKRITKNNRLSFEELTKVIGF